MSQEMAEAVGQMMLAERRELGKEIASAYKASLGL
jgi:hypothetical protein